MSVSPYGHRDDASVTPLDSPRDGTPVPLTASPDIRKLADALASGTGPIALDTERASGYRYGGRAFLVQLRRDDVGTALIDPTGPADLNPLASALADDEWVLHAATQDLPCLREMGLSPSRLFDTELAGRLAGLEKVGLGPLTEQILGLHLAKGHGSDDWSRRPLPSAWLDYAALDVEVLVELRNALEELLRDQGKLDWARQEFAAIVAAPAPTPKPDPWRRTSGIHRVKNRRTLAIIRELWLARDMVAQQIDRAPHRVLPDSAILAAAEEKPRSAATLTSLPVFSGRAQRRRARTWLAAIQRAQALADADLPPARLPRHGPPSASRWKSKNPDAAARLSVAKADLAALSERLQVPVENLMTPSLIRELLWQPPSSTVSDALRAGGARPWQIELVGPIVNKALNTTS